MNDVTKLLEDARQRITDPSHWTQGVLARDAHGTSCTYPSSDDAACWCAIGSLEMTFRELPATEGVYKLTIDELEGSSNRLYGTSISTVNDKYGHEATLKMFDDAIARSKLNEAAKCTP